MFKKLKEAVVGKEPSDTNKTIKPKDDKRVFAGMTVKQIEQEKLKQDNVLTSPVISADVQNSVNQVKEKIEHSGVKINMNASIAEEVATMYSEGDTTNTIKTLKEYLNQNKGNVEQKFWYMLLDSFQSLNDKESYEKVALSFSHKFETSPPSWFETNKGKDQTVMAGQNILLLESTFKKEHTEKFKDFLKAAREQKFCRINVSQCKFEQSEIEALTELYKLFKNLRKYHVVSVLMGDSNLINFCKTYINPNYDNKMLKQEFFKNEELFWLIYLEILQWKGRKEDFETLSLNYAIKFEVSSPGWEDSGVMKIEFNSAEDTQNQDDLDKVLDSNNIQNLLDLIKTRYEDNKTEIDFSSVERIDFSGAGAISFFIQELWVDPKFANKKIIFKYPNEMIVTLLEMVGATEFIDIIPRKR